MKERNVKQEQILESVKYVEAGILYIVDLQSKGWYYIKSGF
jgi:intracellular sulfur oxidation DsrE/DsrF family protein